MVCYLLVLSAVTSLLENHHDKIHQNNHESEAGTLPPF